ncbi:MAG: MATE family efflux transporter [Bacteroidetes bacterium]|nr:MATE family efflux transporter [Bacteroidota bacterium]
MQQNEISLKVSNTYANILKIAFPIGIAILIPQLSILTNTLFLGNYRPGGDLAQTEILLAASGVAGIFYLTMVMIGYGLVSGVLMLMSRKAGEDDKLGLAHIFSNGFLLSIGVSFFMIAISFIFAPLLFKTFIHNPKVADAAISFISIRSWGLPFIIISQLANSFFLALSQSKFIMFGSAAQTIVNVLFDYLLIFGICIFPELGLEGTAIASILSEIAYVIVCYGILHKNTNFTLFPIRYVRSIDTALMKNMLWKSSPLMMQYFLSIGAWEVFFIYVEHLGKSESALSQIYRSVFGLVGVAAWALGSTCNSMVSNIIGQRELNEVIPLIKKIAFLSFSFSFIVGMPILFYPNFFLSLLTTDQHLVETGISSLRIVVLATWMLSISTIFFNGVVGTGNTRINMYFEFIAIFFYLIYITIVIEYLRLPLAYAWLSEFVYWSSLFTLCYIYLYKGKWKSSLQ